MSLSWNDFVSKPASSCASNGDFPKCLRRNRMQAEMVDS